MLSVLIVDSHIEFGRQLADLLSNEPDFEVLGLAGLESEALELVEKYGPDLVLMDFNLPDSDSLHLAKCILGMHPHVSIVFLTESADDESMIAAIRSGAKGFLLKTLSPVKLLASLRGMQAGQAPISRTMVTRLLEEFSRSNHNSPLERIAADQLSPRELDVLRELVIGGSNREIAARLYISEYTVKNHIHSILHKLEVANRREAAKYARQYGLIET